VTAAADRAGPAGRASAARSRRLVRLDATGWLSIALLAILAVLVVAPVAMVAVNAALDRSGFNLDGLRQVLSSTRVIANTLLVSVGSTVVAVGIGGALAFILVRTDVPGRRLLERLVVVPLYVTGLLTAIGWAWLGSPRAGLVNLVARQFLGIDGSLINIQSAGGIVFVAAMNAVPLPFLLIAGALRSMDPSLEESARVQGATLAGAWRRVTLPLILPAVAGSALLVLVHGMGLFAIPAVLGLPADFYVAGTEIYTLLTTYPPRVGRAAAWGLVLLVVTALLVWLQAFVLSRRSFITVTGKAFRPRVIALGPVRYLLAALIWVYLAAAVLLPVLALLWAALINFLTVDLRLMSFDLRHFRYILFEYPKTYIAAGNSILLGLLTATVVTALGLLIGWVLVRGRNRLKLVLDMLGMAPLAIPSLTFALGILWLYVGMRWLPVYGTIAILLIAYTAHFLPLGIRSANSALRQLHPELEEAARVGGANWLKTLRFVTYPLTRPSLVAGWILVFVMAAQEVSASMLLYSSRSIVLSVTVFTLWEQGNISGLAALSVLQLAVMFVLVAILVRSRHRELVS
jgi:iron(III) transport system permease protein